MKTKRFFQLSGSIIFVLAIVLSVQFEVQARPLLADGDFLWAGKIGGAGNDFGDGIAVDTNGNVYITGSFIDTVDFDPGVGIYNLKSTLAAIFVVKLDSNDNFLWAKRVGTPGHGYNLTLDAGGNIYIIGDFAGTVDFDPGPGIYNLTSSVGSIDTFICKLDTDGSFVWAKNLGGTGEDYGWSIAVDTNGDMYAAGEFVGTADFDPGPGTFNLTSTGSSDIFVSKLTSNGDFVWAKSMGGSGYDVGSGIALDSSDNVLTTGGFAGTVDFDPGIGTFNLISSGSLDIFVSKLTSNGDFVWAKSMGGSDYNVGSGIALDSSDNILTTGGFVGTVDFDPSANMFNLKSEGGSQDIFVSKLNSNGDFIWAESVGGASNDYGAEIAIGPNENIYSTGHFGGTADFDPGLGTFSIVSTGGQDIFLLNIESNGNFVWGKSMGGSSNDFGVDITLDLVGHVYVTGFFGGTADFDPGSGTFNLTSAGGNDIFVATLSGTPSNLSPVADAGGPYVAFSGETITLDASNSYDPDGDMLAYDWDLDLDGEYDDVTGATTAVSFMNLGTFSIGLKVTDPGGLSDTDTAEVTVIPVPINIDIKPGSNPNPINLRSKGVIPVAVLTTADFDASTLDPATVVFAGASPLRWTWQDMDWDGDMDLLLHFNTPELKLNVSSIEAILTGKIYDGLFVEGKDSVKIVPPS